MAILDSIHGIINRRLLVNFTADPAAVQKLLPAPFRPQLIEGKAIVGICLIRFSGLRPKFIPEFLGFNTENAAHRIAVEWDGPGGVEQGVYIVRRDSSSYMKTWLGGRVFSGVHHHAKFKTFDKDPRYDVSYRSDDGSTHVVVSGKVAPTLPPGSVFKDLEASSSFFRKGAVGYSPGFRGKNEGMKLVVDTWTAEAFDVNEVSSSFFSDETRFPKGTLHYDHALIMREIPHRWERV